MATKLKQKMKNNRFDVKNSLKKSINLCLLN